MYVCGVAETLTETVIGLPFFFKYNLCRSGDFKKPSYGVVLVCLSLFLQGDLKNARCDCCGYGVVLVEE